MNDRTPAQEPANNSHQNHQNAPDPAADQLPAPVRRSPRLVFNDPDRFFRELLMEQQEQN